MSASKNCLYRIIACLLSPIPMRSCILYRRAQVGDLALDDTVLHHGGLGNDNQATNYPDGMWIVRSS